MRHIFYPVAFSLLAGCVAKSQYDQTLTSYHDVTAQLTKTTQERDACKTRATDLERQVSELEERNQELSTTNQILLSKNKSYVEKSLSTQKEVLKFKKEKQVQDDRVAALEKLADEVSGVLMSETEQGLARVQKQPDEFRVVLSDDLVFKSGTIQVHEGGQALLKKLSGSLKKIREQKIYVESHTDDVPLTKTQKKLFGSHWELSSLRATKVLRALEGFGVKSQKLAAVGFGPSRPVATKEIHEGREKNRRIEIAVVQE